MIAKRSLIRYRYAVNCNYLKMHPCFCFLSKFRRPEQLLLPETVFFAFEERQSEAGDPSEKEEEQTKQVRQRCHSDSVLKATNTDELRRSHEQLCIRRAEAVKQRGISLLNEVDAQYSALQVVHSQHVWV